MEKAFILFLAMLLTGRHLQEDTHYHLLVKQQGRRLKLLSKSKLLDPLCKKDLGSVWVYKSIYCFKKLKKTKGTHLIFTLAQKHHTQKKLKDHLFIYIPFKKWGEVIFL